jgi:16S rRNA C1402 N4-methylase RsmH
VLYLRSDDGRLFAGSDDPQVREQAAKVVTANLDLRGSSFSGADVVVMKVARIKADNVILNLGVTAEQIGDNQSITGVEIDEI